MCKTTTPQGEIWLLHRGSCCNVECKLSGLLMSLWLVLYQTSSTILSWLGDGGIYPLLSVIPYSEKLSREKPFTNFAVLWLFAKVFPMKFGPVMSFGMAKASNLRKFSAQKSPIYKSFLPRKFPTIQYILILCEALHAPFNMLLPTIWIRPVNLTVYCVR